jgi:hypothetical protein
VHARFLQAQPAMAEVHLPLVRCVTAPSKSHLAKFLQFL